ncbi:MAG: NUDIX hydrolase [Deltaproteobacteria bacterium CG_4_10_14_3_um_filter_60_8]|nr:MAG: NUDIX hydrolase [Desulfobacterales bacterium CG2_30_60_27]PIP43603.1 MAG: NUDIX hydrolase [Deltaproteobacteria bacterium CG23_combo_of_CG06-09_8_20_14_all_60_8]PIY20826.1 MAG: NUDIX hydrolase [Deltaproteobacteria bacterium CG_4_10_14_3_um_filter_60_8]
MAADHDPGALILAAGGIIEKASATGPLVALVFREGHNNQWSLPKGKQDPGETLLETACREVEEETGCRVRLTGFGGVTHYYHGRLPKVVLYWRMALVEDGNFTPSDEVQAVSWLPPAKAAARVAHEDERQLLCKIYKLKAQG